MKNVLIAMLLLGLSASAQVVTNRHLQVVLTTADLKNKPVDTDAVVLVVDQSSKMDGMGAAYSWDATSTDAEDLTFYNVVASSLTTTGRWKRVNVKTQVLPHGYLLYNGGLKVFYASGSTNASSELTVNLTMDGTATGTAIFSNILFKNSIATTAVTDLQDVVSSCVKTQTANLKQITFRYWKGNNTVLSALGTVANSFLAAPAGTPVQVKIEGI